MRTLTRFALPTAALCLAAAAPAAAQQPAPTGAATASTVSAIGTGQVRPEPEDRNNNDAIRRAVAAARTEAIPLALASARRRAVQIGFVSGLTVGQTLSVAETQTPFFGPYGEDGTFGPGRFCGTVPRYRIERNAAGRIVKRTRIGTRRTCRVPSRVVASLTVTYAAAPKPAATPAPAA